MLKKGIRIFVIILVLVLLYIGILLGYGTATDYQPVGAETLQPEQQSNLSIITDSSLSFSIWNLGYAGLGKESNFFFDHGNIYLSDGKMVRPEKEITEKNVEGIRNWVASNRTDFVLLQEVDYESKRSYYINTFKICGEQLPGYAAYFAPNYKADYVPIPVFEPWHAYGQVLSGLASYSKFQPYFSERVQLPGSFGWPTRIFQLDRCVLAQKFKTAFGGDLIVLNVHNSAYDKTGELKAQQMAFLKEMMLSFYDEGNFVVVGGDWNQCPPGFPFDSFMPGKTQGYTQISVKEDYLPEDWTFAFDPSTPTNRKIREVYEPGVTFETLIDFYLLSPNLKIKEVKADQLHFEYSDHQPVKLEMEFILPMEN
ncbi:MAG: endonuclease/exonuclease/phosphatase family protein [Saprospiraceae bacterium]|nr:endonuclease/exonuclease/phosphatase family protein [Saprospiraceae bacterium]